MQAAEQAGLRLDADRLRKLIHAGRSLVSEHDLERVFDRVLRAARELTGARHATIREQASNGKRARGRALDVPIVIGDKTSLILHLAGWAAIAVENAQLYRETDQRRAELERSVRALEATSEVARVVGGETRLDRVLELIAARSRALVDARGVMILLADAEEFGVAATAGNVSRELIGHRMQSTNTTAARVLASGQPERIAQVSGFMRSTLAGLGLAPSSAVLSPLVFRGSNVGVIEAFDRTDGPEFRVEDERLLLAAAASAATAVATAQSVQRERLRVLLSTARRSSDVDSLHATLETAVDQLADEITSLRALITELRPPALDELGLRPALEALFNRAQVEHELEVASTVELEHGAGTRDTRLDQEVEIAIYRVVQESLTNAAKHARVRPDCAREGSVNTLEASGDPPGRTLWCPHGRRVNGR